MSKPVFKTAAEILEVNDIAVEVVEVPEWGTSLRISALSALARDNYSKSLNIVEKDGKVKQDLSNYQAKLLTLCIVDELGLPMFTADQLAQKNAMVINRLFDIAQKLNGIGAEAEEEALKN